MSHVQVGAVEVVPLGGLGEFGMNTMAVFSEGTSLLIDAGVMFPGPGSFGVDLIVPDLSHLRSSGQRLSALVLTHGHEDHIGGVPYVWDLLDGPVYGTALTLGLLEPKLDEHGIDSEDRLTVVDPGDTVSVDHMQVEFLPVAHSMPGCTAVAIHGPAGTLIHTGDYKFDHTGPDGVSVDVQRLAELGRAGVTALFGDSTNVERRGVSGSEQDVVEAFEEIFSSTDGKLVVTAFASSVHRLQLLVNLASRFDRQVALVGRGIRQTADIAQRLGYLVIPPGLQIPESDVGRLPPNQVLCVVTGSQGEPLAALSRIAVDQHRHVSLGPGDVVVFSARAIPGNRRAIGRLMDHIARRGAEIVHEDDKRVHVSGHASVEELKMMLSLVRPRYFVPIHGEYRYLARHARVAEAVTNGQTKIMLIENGERLCFDESTAWPGEPVPTGRVLIDGTRTGEVADEVLRDRRHLAGDGVVVLVVAINQHDGEVVGEPEVITRGFATDESTAALLEEIPQVIVTLVQSRGRDERTDHGVVQEQIRIELQRFLRKRSGRRPLVLPVVMEI